MTTPIPSAVYPRAVLALTMGLSTWLNVTHAAVAYPGQSWRWAILAMSAIPPLAVPVLIELVGREARRGGATAAFRGAMGAAVLLTLIAFAVSVWAITSLGMQWGMPLAVAAAFPLVLDLGAAVATTFLLDRAAAEARTVAASTTEPRATAAAPTIAPELAYPASLTWMTPTTAPAPATATEPVAAPVAAAAVTPATETGHRPAATPVTSADTAVVATTATATTTVTDPVEAPVLEPTTTTEQPAATAVEAPATTTRPLQLVAGHPAVSMPATTSAHHAVAADLVADGVLKPGREAKIAAALALIETHPEMSQREIARLAGIDRTVVRKLLGSRMTA
ncbi:hypothetical protein AXK57_19645 [Tsukamurella pulmonis]|uniref:hypothetical protein n=1 Tax=Tsukamurella pulmonis TaxID=47312 RepID=UPI0007974A77|nr:hypothetical protein [Tsukamurella pulmonis]KXP12495.1 hypothetical protein AXK57_19645 [Tsukamurella pulmonis]